MTIAAVGAMALTSPLAPVQAEPSGSGSGPAAGPSSVGTIHGNVYDNGKGRSGVRVSLTDVSGRQPTQYLITTVNGTYWFDAPPGTYVVAVIPAPENDFQYDASAPTTIAYGDEVERNFFLKRGIILTGKVTNPAGKGIANAIVQVHSPPSPVYPDRPTLISEMLTDYDGTYRFRSLPPRPVQVFIMGNPLTTPRYVPEWYWDTPDRGQAQTIDLTSRASFPMGTTILMAVPGTPGTLQGRITAQGSGSALEGVEVRLTTEDGGTVLRTATTNFLGNYTISGITPGNYGLDLVPGPTSAYLPSYGDLVSIVGGNTTTLNDTLERGGAVTGRVMTAQGYPIPGVAIEARIFLYGTMITVASAMADSTGSYTFSALPTDREITFYYTATDLPTYYLPQWYGGGSTPGSAQYVTPSLAQTTTLADTIMALGTASTGTLRGRVLNSGRNAIANARVTAYTATGVPLASGATDEDGVYLITGLPPGPVYLQAVDDTEAYPGFIPEWYLDAATFATASAFTVVGDQTSEVTDIVTDEGAAFRGTVEDIDTRAPVGGVIHVVEAQGTTFTTQVRNGRYNIGGLPPGTYTVYVSPSGGYLPVWWDDAATQAQATVVTAAPGDWSTAEFLVSKTPQQVSITSVVKGGRKERVVTVTWSATVGAARYQVQLARGNRWLNLGTTAALRRVDVLPAGIPWSDSVCYRVRAISPAGTRGPWSLPYCSA